MSNYDYIIITAANEGQAIGFREQIKRRIDNGFLNKDVNYGVVADPPNERIGNGGSTLNALKYIAEEEQKKNKKESNQCFDFSGLKILILLCSGDSKRVPQYSALGKIFSPVPRELPNGEPSTLFDEIILSMNEIPSKINEGAFVLSGDVLLHFDANELSYNNEEAMAVAFPEPVENGTGHGVFLEGKDGNIQKVWHKQSAEFLTQNGAVDSRGQVNIDTGAVFFAPKILNDLYELICDQETKQCTESSFKKYVNGHIAPSLYVDFFYPLSSDATYENYLKETPEHLMSDELLEFRHELWESLRKYRIKLMRLNSGKFIHFGTVDEVLSLMTKETCHYDYLGWHKQVGSKVPTEYAEDKSNCAPAMWCSTVDKNAKVDNSIYLEKSVVPSGCEIGSNTIISYSELQENTIVPANVLLHSMKLDNGMYCCKISGIKENPKSTLKTENKDKSSKQLSFDQLSNNISYSEDSILSKIENAIKQGVLKETDLWNENEEKMLWTARIYPLRTTQAEAINDILDFWTEGKVPALPRTSMCGSFNTADGLSFVE